MFGLLGTIVGKMAAKYEYSGMDEVAVLLTAKQSTLIEGCANAAEEQRMKQRLADLCQDVCE